MKSACIALLLLPVLHAHGVTPVQKVIELMNGMLEKGKKEKHEEQVQYAAYAEFCKNTEAKKTEEIDAGNELIEKLNADISDNRAQVESLTADIAELEKNIATWQGDMKAANKAWQMDKERFALKNADLAESNYALDNAIARAGETMTKDISLVQLFSQSSKKIQAFIAQQPDAYESHSGGILETLEQLQTKFRDQKAQAETEESNAKHAFEMLTQELTAQLEQADTDKTQKLEFRSNKMEAEATAKADLQDTTATRDEDRKYLSDTMATCQHKASAFEKRQQLRAEEIEAIEKAVEIISSGAVSGAADKHLPAFVQKTALAQLRSSSHGAQQEQASEFLKIQATQLDSRMLSEIAAHAASDPFEKVKKMIKDLIVKLMEEAAAEAEQKGWCDTELSTNKQTRKEKTDAVETITAEIDELSASINKLTEDVATLTAEVASLDASMEEATQLRQAEKAKNAETISDAQQAQTAVAQALTVLKEFYAKASEATAFVQQPEIFDSEYKGMQSGNGGVVGMLEVIESDFARLEADTKAGEVTSQKEYDDFMTDSKVDKAAKTTSIDDKTNKKTKDTEVRSSKRTDLDGTQKELDAAMAYFDKLKPTCINTGPSYKERVAQREAEIDSLKEAVAILNGEDIA